VVTVPVDFKDLVKWKNVYENFVFTKFEVHLGIIYIYLVVYLRT
jgi:hypothetical protein